MPFFLYICLVVEGLDNLQAPSHISAGASCGCEGLWYPHSGGSQMVPPSGLTPNIAFETNPAPGLEEFKKFE